MIVTGIVRVLQLIFSVIAIGLSISAVRWQAYGSVPSSGYNAFASAFGIFAALLGFVAIFISSFPGIAMAVVDFLAFIILLAGGIAYAVQVRGVDCNAWNNKNSYANPALYSVMNGGYYVDYVDGENRYFFPSLPYDNNAKDYDFSPLKGRCQTVIADDVFLFLACLTSLAAGILAFMAHRRGRSSAI